MTLRSVVFATTSSLCVPRGLLTHTGDVPPHSARAQVGGVKRRAAAEPRDLADVWIQRRFSPYLCDLCLAATRNYKNIDTNIGGESDNSSGTMSKVQGGMKCVKYLLFAFNFIIWVSRHSHRRWSYNLFYSCNI